MSCARDLTDGGQNSAVLADATAILAGEPVDPATPWAAEADACASARQALVAAVAAGGPVHLSVVFAMYGETARMVPRSDHPHGEDFVAEKVRQLDWLTADLPQVSWSMLACDDGCPDVPDSAELMGRIVAAAGLPDAGHRSVGVVRLADVLDGTLSTAPWTGPEFDSLTSTDQSRKGGAILAALALTLNRSDAPPAARHIITYTDADLSANLAQIGALAAPILAVPGGGSEVAGLGQRYGMPGAVLVKAEGPSREPDSTGGKPDKIIILFRHFVRALLIPDLAHILDTQAGFKAFDATALEPVLPSVAAFNETFDVELAVRLAQHHGASGLAAVPIVFTEDFAATNFPSVDPGERHLAMVRQILEIHDRLVAPVAPASGEAAALVDLLRTLDLPGYVAIITALTEEDAAGDDPTLFERRWPVRRLQQIVAGS